MEEYSKKPNFKVDFKSNNHKTIGVQLRKQELPTADILYHLKKVPSGLSIVVNTHRKYI